MHDSFFVLNPFLLFFVVFASIVSNKLSLSSRKWNIKNWMRTNGDSFISNNFFDLKKNDHHDQHRKMMIRRTQKKLSYTLFVMNRVTISTATSRSSAGGEPLRTLASKILNAKRPNEDMLTSIIRTFILQMNESSMLTSAARRERIRLDIKKSWQQENCNCLMLAIQQLTRIRSHFCNQDLARVIEVPGKIATTTMI